MAELLNKLLVEQTKSRPRHSNDNGLVEAKNGAVIRKHMGYEHIESRHAEAIEEFFEQHFNPYLNYHRPVCPRWYAFRRANREECIVGHSGPN